MTDEPDEQRAIAEALRIWPATPDAHDGLNAAYVDDLTNKGADAIDALLDRLAALEAERAAGEARVVERCAKRAHEELYPTNPEYDWTPYAKYMASAAQRAENGIRALAKQEPGS